MPLPEAGLVARKEGKDCMMLRLAEAAGLGIAAEMSPGRPICQKDSEIVFRQVRSEEAQEV